MQNRETRGRWSRLAETAEKEEAGRRNSIPEMKKMNPTPIFDTVWMIDLLGADCN